MMYDSIDISCRFAVPAHRPNDQECQERAGKKVPSEMPYSSLFRPTIMSSNGEVGASTLTIIVIFYLFVGFLLSSSLR